MPDTLVESTTIVDGLVVKQIAAEAAAIDRERRFPATPELLARLQTL